MKLFLSFVFLFFWQGFTSFASAAQPAITNTEPETIEKNFVRIDILNSKLKSKSLINWIYLNRPQEKEVISYNRIHHFGRWINDRDDKGCYNTRAKVLIRDSVVPVVFKSDDRCNVATGKWLDPYTKTILTDAMVEVQVDHLVPLKNAYVSGAHSWPYKKRCLYANYLGSDYHLKPIDNNENAKKRDDSPAGYIPSNKKYRCTYIKNWLKVKSLWNLEMSLTEASAIKKIIFEESCNMQNLKISMDEIKQHKLFIKKNQDLCPSVAPEVE